MTRIRLILRLLAGNREIHTIVSVAVLDSAAGCEFLDDRIRQLE